jgi:hypothetical protein
MSHKLNSDIAVIGIDIGKNSFHVVGCEPRDNHASAVVTRAGGSTARQSTAVSNRHGEPAKSSKPGQIRVIQTIRTLRPKR